MANGRDSVWYRRHWVKCWKNKKNIRTAIFSCLVTLTIVHLVYCALLHQGAVKQTMWKLMADDVKQNIPYQFSNGLDWPMSFISEGPFFTRKHSADCAAIISSDTDQIEPLNETDRDLLTEYEMSQIFSNCTLFRQRHYYAPKPMSNIEENFPLAYVILINEHLEQIELLFNAIYAPQNYYCFHVDFKAPFVIHYAIRKLTECFPGRVYLSDSAPFPIFRESQNTVYAVLHCLQKLINLDESPRWKYALTLQGHDFPLRTNRELVEILNLHDGMNDVELTTVDEERYKRTYVHTMDNLGQPAGIMERPDIPRPPKPNELLVLYKGNYAGSFSRPFVRFVLENNISKLFLKWLDGVVMPDEFFFSTLNHNEYLKAPGGYPGSCLNGDEERKSWVSRFSLWQWYDDNDNINNDGKRNMSCRGTYRHSVCVFSHLDLPMLAGRPELFLNKFILPQEHLAVDCMHELLFNRTMRIAADQNWKLENDQYYNNLAAVQFGMWRRDKAETNSSDFPCVRCKYCEH